MEILQKKSLFWDVGDLDSQADANFIIARILDLGDTDDFAWAMRFYGRGKVEEALRRSAGLSKKSFSFWCRFFNIDPSTCTARRSANQPSAFSER
jgi:hypothetical protein